MCVSGSGKRWGGGWAERGGGWKVVKSKNNEIFKLKSKFFERLQNFHSVCAL